MTEILDRDTLAGCPGAPQLQIPDLCDVTEALDALANASGTDERGAIFTRREVVDFILDLSGYTVENGLHKKRILEPSFGDGDFLLPAIERLIRSWKKGRGKKKDVVRDLSNSIRAVELHKETFASTRARVVKHLGSEGVNSLDAERLVSNWLIRGDFLLTPLPAEFDFVVGNPPYVRQELIPARLLKEYRARYSTIFDRADLYIPFIERSLSLLSAGGTLGFICADRWMKNRYGGPLRRMISEKFHLRIYVDMVNTPAFHSDVIAYPAITIIKREDSGPTLIARQPEISPRALSQLSKALLQDQKKAEGVSSIKRVSSGDAPWLLESDAKLSLIRAIEARFPALEEVGCKVGIGVATGADGAFIGPFADLDVEDDRKIPLVMTRDIVGGKVEWRGLGVVNPFADEGGLVRLEDYPRLKKYLEARKPEIAGRHVAKKAPANWYRTIDRIFPALTRRSKLLIPDIKGEAHIVYEDGKLYPHHNLYYITSETWDLEALQAVLMSGIARLFVATYSTKMRGGYLRFQAQYLRRIRVPRWETIPVELRERLQTAARTSDVSACNTAAIELYRLTKAEAAILKGGIDGN